MGSERPPEADVNAALDRLPALPGVRWMLTNIGVGWTVTCARSESYKGATPDEAVDAALSFVHQRAGEGEARERVARALQEAGAARQMNVGPPFDELESGVKDAWMSYADVAIAAQRAGEPPTPDEVERLREALEMLTEAAQESAEQLQRMTIGEGTTSTLAAVSLGLKHPLRVARAALDADRQPEGER